MTKARKIPLFIGHPREAAVITAADFLGHGKLRRARLPEIAIVTFAYRREYVEWAKGCPGVRAYPLLGLAEGLFRFRWRKINNVLAVAPAVGAPIMAVMVETLAVLGMRRMVLVGNCGALSDDVPRGRLVLPTFAVRDEGTSYHYARPAKVPKPSPKLLRALRGNLQRRNLAFVEGGVWTTDALLRETPRKVRLFREQGCVCVDMEASAFFTVAEYCGCEAAALLTAADSVAGSRWNRRRTKRHLEAAAREKAPVCEIACETLAAE